MSQTPKSLPERPDRAADDALSEIFRAVRFTRALYYTVNTGLPWPTIRIPVGQALAPGLGFRTQNVLSYHVITEGSCWTGLEGHDSIRLEKGDVVVYPRGHCYFMSSERAPGSAPADVASLVGLLQGVAAGMLPPNFTVGGPGERTSFICGFLGCDPRPFDPLLSALPPIMIIRGTDERLAHLVKLAFAELDGAGSQTVRERLSESMFIETVRRHLTELRAQDTGWLQGLSDPVVGRALAELHAKPSEPWTLASLAKEVGASRSALAERFTKLVGQPPMAYLTKWRMQMAAHLLRQGNAKVSAVALEVGYDSEAAFSRAFKKATGTAPAAFRGALPS
jgi:AraC-like DNA-binding protein